MRPMRNHKPPAGAKGRRWRVMALSLWLACAAAAGAELALSSPSANGPVGGAPDALVGVYERKLCEAVSARWMQLLARRESIHQTHRVLVSFTLCADGSVTNFSLEHGLSDQGLALTCQKSIVDAAPFGAWFSGMNRRFGETRCLRLVFDYDNGGNPILAFAEQDPPEAGGRREREPVVWYLPCQRRLASAAERPWVGKGFRRTTSVEASPDFGNAWYFDSQPFHVSSLFWPPPEWSAYSGWNSLFFGADPYFCPP